MTEALFERYAYLTLRSTEPAVAAHILDACRNRRKALSTENMSERRFCWTQVGTHCLQAVSLAHTDKGFSAETMLRIAAALAERIN